MPSCVTVRDLPKISDWFADCFLGRPGRSLGFGHIPAQLIFPDASEKGSLPCGSAISKVAFAGHQTKELPTWCQLPQSLEMAGFR